MYSHVVSFGHMIFEVIRFQCDILDFTSSIHKYVNGKNIDKVFTYLQHISTVLYTTCTGVADVYSLNIIKHQKATPVQLM